MTRVTVSQVRRQLAGVLVGLLSASAPAQAGGAMEERAAVSALLADRGQAALSTSLPQHPGSDEEEVGRLLSQPLTVNSAVRLALLNHRGVRASLAALGVPRGQLMQDSLPPNPEVEVSLRAPSDSVQPLQAEIGVDYEISALLVLPLRRAAARTELYAARQRAACEILDVAYRARLAFYEVAARTQQLALRQQARDLAAAAYAVREELFRAGNTAALDLEQERAAKEAARLGVAEAELAMREARERLNAALGLAGTQTAWSLAKDALSASTAPPSEDAEQRAIDASLELAALRGQAVAAEQRARLHRATGVLPHLGAGFHGEHDGGSWELGGHFSLSLPLFNQNQGRVAAAHAEAGALRERLLAVEAELRARVRIVMARLSLSLSRAQILREGVVPARERALRELQLQYNGMQMSVFQLLDARRLLFDAQAAYVDALREAQEARAALELLLSGHSPELGGAGARANLITSAAAEAAH